MGVCDDRRPIIREFCFGDEIGSTTFEVWSVKDETKRFLVAAGKVGGVRLSDMPLRGACSREGHLTCYSNNPEYSVFKFLTHNGQKKTIKHIKDMICYGIFYQHVASTFCTCAVKIWCNLSSTSPLTLPMEMTCGSVHKSWHGSIHPSIHSEEVIVRPPREWQSTGSNFRQKQLQQRQHRQPPNS